MRKVAFCTVPHTGGIYSVYQRLRSSLRSYGWDVRCIYFASEKSKWYGYHPSLVDDGCVELGEENDDMPTAAREFVRWVNENDVGIVIPLTSMVSLSATPHLPSTVQVITRCTNVTPLAYRTVAAFPKRTAAVVVTALRQRVDLNQSYGIPPEKLWLVPNGIDVTKFSAPRRTYENQTVRLGFVDRINARHKCVMALPVIADRLDKAGINWTLQIVGNGRDEQSLKQALAKWSARGNVEFVGAIPYSEMPGRFSAIDILLKPTRFEGFPSSLVEGMSSGVVPVCSRIAGVTDWIIRDGENGRLVPIGDTSGMADAVISLFWDREKLKLMSENARRTIMERFNLDDFGDQWNRVLASVVNEALVWDEPLPWSRFQLAPPWNRPWKERVVMRSIPRWMKDWVRKHLENRRTMASDEVNA